jgi:hypothetical protein
VLKRARPALAHQMLCGGEQGSSRAPLGELIAHERQRRGPTGRVGGLLIRMRDRYPKDPAVLALADEYRSRAGGRAMVGGS